jgi:hypothetical protein
MSLINDGTNWVRTSAYMPSNAQPLDTAYFAILANIPNMFNGLAVLPAGQIYSVINGVATPQKQRTSVLKIATYGDSTANYGDSQNPANNDTSYATAAQPSGGAIVLNIALDKHFLPALYPAAKFVTNCGVSGRTVATMITDEATTSSSTTRKIQDAGNNYPDVLLIRGGSINDFTAASYTAQVILEATYQTILANHKKIITWAASSSIGLVMDEGIYGYSAAVANTVGIQAALIRFNADVALYISALNSKNIIFINPVGNTCDSTGAYLPGMSTDGTHLSAVGAITIAIAEQNRIESYYGVSGKTTFTGKNKALNPVFAQESTANGGQYPTNYLPTNQGNSTLQNAAMRLIKDTNWATIDLLVTANGNCGISIPLPYNPTAGGTNPLNIAINDRYGFEMDVSVENLTSGIVYGISRLDMVITTYNQANDALTRIINQNVIQSGNAATSSSGIPGKLVVHLNVHEQVYQEAAANYGTTSSGIVYVILSANAGDVVRIGYANPRIVKL